MKEKSPTEEVPNWEKCPGLAITNEKLKLYVSLICWGVGLLLLWISWSTKTSFAASNAQNLTEERYSVLLKKIDKMSKKLGIED